MVGDARRKGTGKKDDNKGHGHDPRWHRSEMIMGAEIGGKSE
jgi:hypothetical protein